MGSFMLMGAIPPVVGLTTCVVFPFFISRRIAFPTLYSLCLVLLFVEGAEAVLVEALAG